MLLRFRESNRSSELTLMERGDNSNLEEKCNNPAPTKGVLLGFVT